MNVKFLWRTVRLSWVLMDKRGSYRDERTRKGILAEGMVCIKEWSQVQVSLSGTELVRQG